MEKSEESVSEKEARDNGGDKERLGKDPYLNHCEQDGPTNNKKGRPEKRPRPKRNKKRPRSQVHSNDDLKISTTIKRLELDGETILDREGGVAQFIRVIHPYPYTFSSFAKQRWVGRTVLDVYVSEFGSYPESYYKAAIHQGRILVSDNKVDVDYKIKGKDVLTHLVHRHEPGVAVYPTVGAKESATNEDDASNLVNVIDETDDLLVLDKPGTMPIHPCGGYHLNSLTSILEGEAITQAKRKYFNIHRLDRLTSGLVILAKSSEVAKHWSQCIRQRDCEKYYLARVRGSFPVNLEKLGVPRLQTGENGIPRDGEWNVENDSATPIERARQQNAHGYWIADLSGNVRDEVSLQEIAASSASVDEWLEQVNRDDKDRTKLWVHLACPTRISKPKNGVCEAGTFEDLPEEPYLKTVKPAQTSFGVVAYDAASDSTLLLCRPVTGRTHQIRLHLQYLSHPIANDPNYGGDIWYGNDSGRAACAKAQVLLGNTSVDASDGDKKEVMDKNTADVPASKEEIEQLSNIEQKDGEPVEEFIKRTCVWCARTAGRAVAEQSMLEFLLRSRGIWLHALQYCIEADGKPCRFRTELPSWALPR